MIANSILTTGMDTEQIIAFAATRPEPPWHWSCQIKNNPKIIAAAADLEVELEWGQPIRPGDLYIAMRNTGPKLLTCKILGEACVHAAVEGHGWGAYPYECVRVSPSK